MSAKIVVAGVGMIPFRKPGDHPPYFEMGAEAARLALVDAGLDYGAVQQAFVGYVYGDSTSGQRALYEVGLTGIPIVNVNNNCSTGSTALYLARQAIAAGADCVLALGFEQMKPGALGAVFTDRPTPFDRFEEVTGELVGEPQIPLALRYFGGAGREHMQLYGTSLETFAQIRAKASRHAEQNPLALFRKPVTVDQVMNDVQVWPGVMTRLMACPPTCGAVRGRWRQHLRRQGRHQSVGRAAVQGPSARRHGPGAVLRADAATAWQGRGTPGRRRAARAAAQSRPRRRLRRHALWA